MITLNEDHPGVKHMIPLTEAHPGVADDPPGGGSPCTVDDPLEEAHPGIKYGVYEEVHPGVADDPPGEAHPGAVKVRPGLVEAQNGAVYLIVSKEKLSVSNNPIKWRL
jgi:hypothetical protein